MAANFAANGLDDKAAGLYREVLAVAPGTDLAEEAGRGLERLGED